MSTYFLTVDLDNCLKHNILVKVNDEFNINKQFNLQMLLNQKHKNLLLPNKNKNSNLIFVCYSLLYRVTHIS